MNESILEIAKYTIPSLISLAEAILIVRLFLKKEEDYKRFEITIKNRNPIKTFKTKELLWFKYD
jgi:hypothetical protein